MAGTDYKLDVAWIKAEADKQGLTQGTLADGGGISLSSLGNALRTGFASVRIANSIARGLGVGLNRFARPTEAIPGIIPDNDSLDDLDDDALLSRLRRGSVASASCCAFLAGDFSVLTTKQALIFPVDARIHASVHGLAAGEFRVQLYHPHGDQWRASADVGRRTANRLRKALANKVAASHYPTLRGIDATVVSELPPRFAIYEETAIALALARAIASSLPLRMKHESFEILRLAALLLTGWYDDVTWATLVASSLDVATFSGVVAFDRRGDGGIDLVRLYERSMTGTGVHAADFERNIHPAKPFWTERKIFSFDRDLFTIWWNEDLAASIDAREGFQGHRLKDVDAGYVIDRMQPAIQYGDYDKYRKIGLLMQLHQLELDAAELVHYTPRALLNKVNDLPGIRGAKLACWRGTGAIVVLAEPPSDKKNGSVGLRKLGLRPMEDYRRRIVL